jgi:cysteine desulfuration protein SufE
MTEPQSSLPPRLQEIVADFELAEGREKLELLLQYADSLPPLPEALQQEHDKMDAVPECMTPVFMQAEAHDGKMYFHFDAPRESPTVRGFAAIMAQGFDGATPQQVLQTPGDFFHQMGLDTVLTHQRLNGLSAILAHMKQLAVKQIEVTS